MTEFVSPRIHRDDQFDRGQALTPTLLSQQPAINEQNEMAAFEKGRMQGEMEAIRRMENDTTQLKQFPGDNQLQQLPIVAQPDVVEINRLTLPQWGCEILGELTAIAYVVITIYWLDQYHGGFGWSDANSSDNIGNFEMYNTHLMCSVLGLFCLSQAITLYRVLPLNFNPWLNRGIYLFFQACAVTAFIISLVGLVKTFPETTFWAADDWCFAAAITISVLHSLYSMVVCLLESMFPVDYENWSETSNRVTFESPEQRRDHSTFGPAGRTIYTPAPVYVPRTASTIPPANANVGAEVPVAPANAPRWSENPNTFAENYFLMPRAKWAVCGFVGMGAVTLMDIAQLQHVWAGGHLTWSQDNSPASTKENGEPNWLISTGALILLVSILCFAYVAMPPRTTLVKNGFVTEAGSRRASISHNAETLNNNPNNIV